MSTSPAVELDHGDKTLHMNLFVWTDALATGNRFIDQDHHLLVVHVNAVLQAIAQKQPGHHLTLILNDLVTFTREHFEREEAEMRRIAFKNADMHMAEHVRLLVQIDEVREQLRAGQDIRKMDLYQFLTWWVKDHIRLLDTELAAALHQFR